MKSRLKWFYLTILLFIPISVLAKNMQTGADSLIRDPLVLKGKNYALCMNSTSRLEGGKFLLDSLISLGYAPEFIFAPEHGFPVQAGAGEKIEDGRYRNIPVISLYGKSRTPPDSIMRQIDLVIYDLQDVGLRFYTYISTLKNLVLACAKDQKELWILDRPDPLGGVTVEGPVLSKGYTSFVGAWPIPIRYGLTPAELVTMGLGEGWIPEIGLKVFPLKNWSRDDLFPDWERPWIPPSPNLPGWKNLKAYSGLCFLEGTVISEGRGTHTPFLIFGYPDSVIWNANIEMGDMDFMKVHFTPRGMQASRYPKYKDRLCYGFRFEGELPESGVLYKTYYWLDALYRTLNPEIGEFFIRTSTGRYFLDLLYGNSELREKIRGNGKPDELIERDRRESKKFLEKAKEYWLYR